jgi:GTP cyclohydrolase II
MQNVLLATTVSVSVSGPCSGWQVHSTRSSEVLGLGQLWTEVKQMKIAKTEKTISNSDFILRRVHSKCKSGDSWSCSQTDYTNVESKQKKHLSQKTFF